MALRKIVYKDATHKVFEARDNKYDAYRPNDQLYIDGWYFTLQSEIISGWAKAKVFFIYGWPKAYRKQLPCKSKVPVRSGVEKEEKEGRKADFTQEI